LKLFRQFYFTYSQIGQSVIGQLSSNFQLNPLEFKSIENQILKIGQLAIAQSANQQMVPPEAYFEVILYHDTIVSYCRSAQKSILRNRMHQRMRKRIGCVGI
jgi:hypothetical protein